MAVIVKVTLVCDICGKKNKHEFPVRFNRKGGVIDDNFPEGWGRTYNNKYDIACSSKCAAQNPPETH